MRTITGDYFTELVIHAYDFLEKNYGFTYIGTEDTPRQIFVNYRKGELIVRVTYSHANYFTESIIYNHVTQVPPPKYNWKYSVAIMHLLNRYEPSFDYNSIMPKVIPLEESLKKTAELLRKYEASILSGEEWVP